MYETRDKALQALRNLPKTERFDLVPLKVDGGWELHNHGRVTSRSNRGFRARLAVTPFDNLDVPFSHGIAVKDKPGYYFVAAPYPVDIEAVMNRGWGDRPILKRSVDTKPT